MIGETKNIPLAASMAILSLRIQLRVNFLLFEPVHAWPSERVGIQRPMGSKVEVF